MMKDVDKLLDLLVCPESHARLVYDEGSLVSTDPLTRRRYEIRSDIPVMLVDESEQLAEAEWRAIMQRHGRNPENGQLASGVDG